MTRSHHSRPGETLFVDSLLVLVHSNLLIAIAATSVAISTVILTDLHFDALPLFIVFSVTLFVYSFNRITDVAEDRHNLPDRSAFVQQYGRRIFYVGTILYVGATVIAIVEQVPGAPGMLLPLIIALLYSVVGVKRIILVKNVLVGLAWGLIPLGVGVYYGTLWSVEILFIACFIGASITIAAIVFDIKDLPGDAAEGIVTVPLLLGPRRTRRLAAGSIVLVSIPVLGLVLGGVLADRYLLLLAFTAYVFGYCLEATVDRGPLFYGFVVDGEHIFLAILLVLYEYGLPAVVS